MLNTKRYITITIIVFLMITMITMAQDRRGNSEGRGRQNPEQMMKQLTIELKLSADQQEKITSLFREHHEEMMKNRPERDGNREVLREKMMKQQEEFDMKVIKLLDEDQVKKYKIWREHNRRPNGNMQPNRNKSNNSNN